MITEKAKHKQVVKARKKLRRLQGKKKLKRHVIDALKAVEARRHVKQHKYLARLNEEWVEHTEAKATNFNDEDELPLDMMDDDDGDWENSAFAAAAMVKNIDEEGDLDSYETKVMLKNKGEEENYRDLLPIKVDGKLFKRRIKEEVEEDEEVDAENSVEGSSLSQSISEGKKKVASNLTAAELLKERSNMVEEAKIAISSCAYAILADPQEQIRRLKELLIMCSGQGLHLLVRETVQILALLSTAEVFINIIPGYMIRLPTESEAEQKHKKDTKKLLFYEESLLRNYQKYLRLLEKNALKLLLIKREKTGNENLPFRRKLALVSLNCFCRLAKSAPHFNYSTDILATIIKISASKDAEVVDVCCAAVGEVFHNDFTFQISAVGARLIASFVQQKKCDVSPKVLATFLQLNIKEVDKGDNSKTKEKLVNKRFKLARERKSKSRTKYAKQLAKLEAELIEAEAAESLTVKLKNATETMKSVFATYFRILKRMPNTNLLGPVLEGISKFAHLLNIEFFEDIITAMENLVEKQCLSLLNSIHCIHAVFVILSGEGVALNIDPFRFYHLMYRLLCSLPFERSREKMLKQIDLVLRTLYIMLVVRKKQVPLPRVAAFVKRLTDVALYLPSSCTVAILALLRQIIMAHSRCVPLVDGSETISVGLFKPEVDNPDCCDALSSSCEDQLKVLCKHGDQNVVVFAKYLLAGLPSTGSCSLDPHITARKPYEWLSLEAEGETDISYHPSVLQYCKENGLNLSSRNLEAIICDWCRVEAARK